MALVQSQQFTGNGPRRMRFGPLLRLRVFPQGLKPRLICGAFLARLKPCPCYKTSCVGFFRSQFGPAAFRAYGWPG